MTKQSPPSEYRYMRYDREEELAEARRGNELLIQTIADLESDRAGLEARCARLTELLREMTGWSDKQIEEGIASDFGALSDTAQQETPQRAVSSATLIWEGGEVKGAAEMRERAAKLADRWGKSLPLFNEFAAEVRALPIDPETGGADS